MIKVKNKKLMVLGGSRYILPIIEKAHELGICVITCDYLPDNIAHKYSDLYCNISIIDKDAVLAKAKELEIDGIMSFACDPGVITAAYVAEKMDLPSVGSYEAVSILQNKGKFRKYLTDNGFNVPVSKSYNKNDDVEKDIQLFNWPVIVKPTDSAGSKGVTKVNEPKDLKKAIEVALSYSHCSEFIIEDFLEQDGYSSDCDCFSIDGKMVFYSFNCQRFDKNAENPYTPSAYSWPSSMSEKNEQELKREIQRLVDLLNLKNSVYNVETRQCVNGKTYIMEFSPRGGGNRLSEMVRILTGVDLIENSIRAALGMPLNKLEQKPEKFNLAEIILHSDKAGIFKKLVIDEKMQDKVIEEDLWVKQGDQIGGFKGANEAIGTLVLKFNNKNELDIAMSDLDDWLTIELEK